MSNRKLHSQKSKLKKTTETTKTSAYSPEEILVMLAQETVRREEEAERAMARKMKMTFEDFKAFKALKAFEEAAIKEIKLIAEQHRREEIRLRIAEAQAKKAAADKLLEEKLSDEHDEGNDLEEVLEELAAVGVNVEEDQAQDTGGAEGHLEVIQDATEPEMVSAQDGVHDEDEYVTPTLQEITNAQADQEDDEYEHVAANDTYVPPVDDGQNIEPQMLGEVSTSSVWSFFAGVGADK